MSAFSLTSQAAGIILTRYVGILVRDSAARQRLKDEFGKIGQVLYVRDWFQLALPSHLLFT